MSLGGSRIFLLGRDFRTDGQFDAMPARAGA
jgi:hypothetical protein